MEQIRVVELPIVDEPGSTDPAMPTSVQPAFSCCHATDVSLCTLAMRYGVLHELTSNGSYAMMELPICLHEGSPT
jgi:hypothetical protein